MQEPIKLISVIYNMSHVREVLGACISSNACGEAVLSVYHFPRMIVLKIHGR